MKTRDLVIGALLTALALIIPIFFGSYLRIYIPPFSATLASHVPTMIAFLISPAVAIMVGLGSSLGFLIMMGPVVAAEHLFTYFWTAGALLVKKGFHLKKPFATAPIHAIGEVLVVLPFGFTFNQALIMVGIGTLLHHTLDGVVAVVLARLVLSGVKLANNVSN